MSKRSTVLCNDTGCTHCDHGQCTCWKVELVADQGNGLLCCNTYSPRHVLYTLPYPMGDDPAW